MQVSRNSQIYTSTTTSDADKAILQLSQQDSDTQGKQTETGVTPVEKTDRIDESFNRLKKQLDEMKDTKVQMEFDKDIDRVIIRYSNRTTGEVVHQIPTKQFVEFEKEFNRVCGLLFDKKV